LLLISIRLINLLILIKYYLKIYLYLKHIMDNLHLLENNWTLWFHNINNNDWSIDSYDKIYSFNSVETFIKLYRKINNFSAGMFFLMKDPIEPMWENEYNRKGGYWSFKVL
jgi:hypothetical protein